jgi:hypothetical protein
MLIRFCLYSVFKNLRPFEAFFILFLLSPTQIGGADLSNCPNCGGTMAVVSFITQKQPDVIARIVDHRCTT